MGDVFDWNLDCHEDPHDVPVVVSDVVPRVRWPRSADVLEMTVRYFWDPQVIQDPPPVCGTHPRPLWECDDVCVCATCVRRRVRVTCAYDDVCVREFA